MAINNKFVIYIILLLGVGFFVSQSISNEFIQDIMKVDYPTMLMGFLGGVSFLLYGLDKMSIALKTLAGDNLKSILGKLTRTKISSLMTGITITAAIQSSAATTVMVVGFIAIQAIKLPQALGVILGADIGTTITVQLIAFKLNEYGLIAIWLGFSMQLLAKNERYISIGHAILGIGMIFFGINLISESMGIIRDIPAVVNAMTHMKSPLTGIFIGMVLTILMQSSAATLAVIIALASHQILSLEASLILVLGANVGTCLTALIASSGKNRQSLQAAMGHISFKIIGVTLAVILFSYFMQLVSMVSMNNLTSQGIATARDVANAHMIFNIILAILFLPFVNKIAVILQKIIPLREKDKIIKPKYLDKGLIHTPSLAIEAVKLELKRVADITEEILIKSMPAVLYSEGKELTTIKRKEKDVDILYKECIKYLSILSRERMSENNSNELTRIINLANNLENISDIAGDEMVKLGRKRIRLHVEMNKDVAETLSNLHSKVLKAYKQTIKAAINNDIELAQKTIKMKHSIIRPTIEELKENQTKGLLIKGENRFNTYSVEVDIIDRMKQIFYHSRRISLDVISYNETNNTEKLSN